MQLPVYDITGKAVGKAEVSDAVFGVPVNQDLLHQALVYHQANQRQGSSNTLTRGHVSGGGRKPFRQKGTGRARRGSLRAGLLRGGQTTHGPVVRSHAHDLPKKLRKLALCHALSAKQRDGKLVVLDKAVVKAPKTKTLAAKFAKLGWSSALIVDGDGTDENFRLAARNIPEIDLLPQIGANVYDILRRDLLVLTRDAVEKLQERL